MWWAVLLNAAIHPSVCLLLRSAYIIPLSPNQVSSREGKEARGVLSEGWEDETGERKNQERKRAVPKPMRGLGERVRRENRRLPSRGCREGRWGEKRRILHAEGGDKERESEIMAPLQASEGEEKSGN